MKSQARVVIVGGGMFGVSLLYHLTLEGWRDVVLCEKGELTSGSTWHAAGLVANFIGSLNLAKIHHYGSTLYPTLEAETGQDAGWHGCGGIRLATNTEELNFFKYVEGFSKLIGFEMHIIGPNEIRNLHPFLETFGVLAGAYTTHDGHVDPSSAANAMAIGARQNGAEIYRQTLVTGISQRPGGEWEVVTDKGTITCEHVVNAAGSYAPQVGAMVGLAVPLVNMRHQYVVTEPLEPLKTHGTELPVVRDPYSSSYLRQEQMGLLVGPYETEGSRIVFEDGVPWSFEMELFEPELDAILPWLERATERLPLFAEAGIRRVINGAITHTPDDNFLLGPAPGLHNHWMACGASIGIAQGAGAGKYLAQWMVLGQAEINMAEFDPRRFDTWAGGDYSRDKAIEAYQHMYAIQCPGEYRAAGRQVRTTPIYEKLKAKGAVFAAVFGWERPKWFAPDGVEEAYSFRRSNAFSQVGAECRAVRERVGLLDLSSFAKYDVTGPGAEARLSRLCANRIPRRDGGMALTHMLSEAGMIEAEMTVTRLGPERYYVLSGAASELRDFDLLRRPGVNGEAVDVTNVTDDYGVLVLAGPRSRALLATLTGADLSNANFRWLSGREITVAGVPCRALRVSYVGELGWELHHPMAEMARLYDALMAAGAAFGIADFGVYAVNSLRLEKGYKGYGSELTNEITMIEADMERFINFDKGDFIGRAATLQRKQDGIALQCVYLTVEADDADPLGNEPIYAGDKLVGVSTSGAYGYAVGTTIAFAYIEPGYAVPGTELTVLILGDQRRAVVQAEPLYDPNNARMRA